MRLGILWRIMEIEEGVVRRGRRSRRITPSEISVILHMIRKPNSIIVLLFIQNNFKNKLTCIDVKFIFDSLRLGLSSSANILQKADVTLIAIILPSSSCSSYSWNEWSVHYFSFYNENNSISSPGLLV